MRILFVGDVVGRSGRTAISEHLPGMIRDWALDLVIVNGENAAGGFGITEAIYQEFIDAGADAVTLGNHSWDQREALVFIERAPRLVRPANFPQGTPGRGAALVDTKNGKRALVINAIGRVFMTPFDDPFAAVDRELEACPLRAAADAIVVDFHGEASSEKQGIGFFCDGRASLVVGTHTHVPTADHQILPGGTAYMTDAGMTGDYDSIIGMQKEEPLRRFTSGIPSGRFEPAAGAATLSGVAVETDDSTGLALRIAPVRMGGRLEPTLPGFWVNRRGGMAVRLRPGESPCGRRPSGGRGRRSATKDPSSGRNCRRPCRGGRSAAETAWVGGDLAHRAVIEQPPVAAMGIVPDRIAALRQAVVRVVGRKIATLRPGDAEDDPRIASSGPDPGSAAACDR